MKRLPCFHSAGSGTLHKPLDGLPVPSQASHKAYQGQQGQWRPAVQPVNVGCPASEHGLRSCIPPPPLCDTRSYSVEYRYPNTLSAGLIASKNLRRLRTVSQIELSSFDTNESGRINHAYVSIEVPSVVLGNLQVRSAVSWHSSETGRLPLEARGKTQAQAHSEASVLEFSSSGPFARSPSFKP